MSVELLFYCPNTGRHLVQWRQEPGSVIVMDCPGPERRRDQSRPSDLCLGSLASHINLLQWTRKHISCITRKQLLALCSDSAVLRLALSDEILPWSSKPSNHVHQVLKYFYHPSNLPPSYNQFISKKSLEYFLELVLVHLLFYDSMLGL